MGLNWFTNRVGRAPTDPPNASRLVPGQAVAGSGDALTPSWQDMVRQLGEEVATSLNSATEQLTRLNRLEPGLVRSLAPVQDAVERARQAGMAAQHVLRLCEDPPPQRREVLNLADVAHAALTARGDWLRLRRINVRKGFSPAPVFADAALLYQLIDEMLLWVGQLGADIAVSVEPAHASGRPRVQVISQRAPSAAPAAVWRGVRWVLWHQLARTLEAQTELDLKDEHVRISVSLPAATPEQMAHAAEAQVEPSSVSAVISGCRVLIVSDNAQRRAQCLQALAGYGLIIDTADDTHQAQQLALQRLPDAVIYDASLPIRDVRLLRGQLLENAGTPSAFIEIHDQPGSADFHASTVGNESTGHVSAAALGQALGPALVFELCRVL